MERERRRVQGGGDKERKSLCGDAEDEPHVNLNPCREQRRRAGRQNKVGMEGGAEWWVRVRGGGCQIFVFLLSPLSSQRVIRPSQAAAGKSLRTPSASTGLLIAAFISTHFLLLRQPLPPLSLPPI